MDVKLSVIDKRLSNINRVISAASGIGGLPGLPGTYLYLFFNISSASERSKLDKVFLKLALLFYS